MTKWQARVIVGILIWGFSTEKSIKASIAMAKILLVEEEESD